MTHEEAFEAFDHKLVVGFLGIIKGFRQIADDVERGAVPAADVPTCLRAVADMMEKSLRDHE